MWMHRSPLPSDHQAIEALRSTIAWYHGIAQSVDAEHDKASHKMNIFERAATDAKSESRKREERIVLIILPIIFGVALLAALCYNCWCFGIRNSLRSDRNAEKIGVTHDSRYTYEERSRPPVTLEGTDTISNEGRGPRWPEAVAVEQLPNSIEETRPTRGTTEAIEFGKRSKRERRERADRLLHWQADISSQRTIVNPTIHAAQGTLEGEAQKQLNTVQPTYGNCTNSTDAISHQQSDDATNQTTRVRRPEIAYQPQSAQRPATTLLPEYEEMRPPKYGKHVGDEQIHSGIEEAPPYLAGIAIPETKIRR
jgi:hypothetical protein